MDVFMTGMTVLSPSTWGGAGTSTDRDVQFTAIPATGTTWYDTDTNALQVSDGTAWVDPLLFREAGVDKAKVYYDDTNDRLVLEDGDWSTDVGVHGRIYINDVDGKLFHQTKDTATPATALSLTPGYDMGLQAETLGSITNVNKHDGLGGTYTELTKASNAGGVAMVNHLFTMAHGGSSPPILSAAFLRITGSNSWWSVGDEIWGNAVSRKNDGQEHGWMLVFDDTNVRWQGGANECYIVQTNGQQLNLSNIVGDFDFVTRCWW
jgi:hypothetical protein